MGRPRRTVRLRLTVLYGALVVGSGAALLALAYVLVAHSSARDFFARVSAQASGTGTAGPLTGGPVTRAAGTHASGAVRWADLPRLITESALALAVLAIGSVAVGWTAAGRALRPLRTMTAKSRRITASSLHERLAVDGPDDELKKLADTFDALISRLEAAFAAQRQFVANASHELRTPLTAERALLEMVLTDPTPTMNAYQSVCEQLLVSNVAQARLIDGLLTLARSQRGLDQHEPMSLDAVASRVIDARHGALDVAGLDLDADLEPASATGSPQLVERLIANLVDNAVIHNRPGGNVHVATGELDGHPWLTVTNTGPVVPPTVVGRLLQPFEQHDASRLHHGGGVGLGLSIVEAITTAHGAALRLVPQDEGGLRVEVVFPRPAVDEPAVVQARAPARAGRV